MNEEHLKILKQGVPLWNQWRMSAIGEIPELRRANLREMDLAGVNFESANLEFANFENANLIGADFDYSELSGTTFNGAKLDNAHFVEATVSGAGFVRAQLSHSVFSVADGTYADFSGATLCDGVLYHADLTSANFTHADLSGADLSDTNFTRAKFDRTDLSGAMMGGTVLAAVDLSRTRGLEKIQHLGPSSVGFDTLYLSQGLSDIFLRGCGAPEGLISHAITAAERDQFYSCFISHSSRDAEFVARLHARMQQSHMRVYVAPNSMRGGKKLKEQIDTAIRLHDKLLLVLSEASLQSEWVMTELRQGFKAEKESGKRKLFPIRLIDLPSLRRWQCFDVDSGKDLAAEVREYFIPDFSIWKKQEEFEAAFFGLVNDLRIEQPARMSV